MGSAGGGVRREQFIGADAIQDPCSARRSAGSSREMPATPRRPRRARATARNGMPYSCERAPRTARGARGAGGFEHVPARSRSSRSPSRHNSRSSTVAEHARRARRRATAGGVLLAQPAAEIAHARRGPDVAAGRLMAALDRIEQRRRKFGVRRKHGVAGLDRPPSDRGSANSALSAAEPCRGSDHLQLRPPPRPARRAPLRCARTPWRAPAAPADW